MTTKYAIYDSVNGVNILFDTKEEALQQFWAKVVLLAKSHHHDTAYMVVEQNEDGSETWFNDNNDEITRPKTREEIEAAIEEAKKLVLAADQQTPVEILP